MWNPIKLFSKNKCVLYRENICSATFNIHSKSLIFHERLVNAKSVICHRKLANSFKCSLLKTPRSIIMLKIHTHPNLIIGKTIMLTRMTTKLRTTNRGFSVNIEAKGV